MDSLLVNKNVLENGTSEYVLYYHGFIYGGTTKTINLQKHNHIYLYRAARNSSSGGISWDGHEIFENSREVIYPFTSYQSGKTASLPSFSVSNWVLTISGVSGGHAFMTIFGF